MTISAILAVSRNRVIGKNNDLPWHLPADMKYFMNTTRNHHIIMGRKTFESLGKPLKNRVNIVLTRDLFYAASGIIVTHTMDEALQVAEDGGESEVFIIGGAEIYRQSLPVLDKIYITEIDLEVEGGDAFFDELNSDFWELDSCESHQPDEKNKYPYSFKVFKSKSPADAN